MNTIAAKQVLELERDRIKSERAHSLRMVPSDQPAARAAIESLYDTRTDALDRAVKVLEDAPEVLSHLEGYEQLSQRRTDVSARQLPGLVSRLRQMVRG